MIIGQAANPGAGFDDPEWSDGEPGGDMEHDGYDEQWAFSPDEGELWRGGNPKGTEVLVHSAETSNDVGPRGEPEAVTPFMAAKKFSGGIPGFAFKKGHLGLGYYGDDSVAREISTCSDESHDRGQPVPQSGVGDAVGKDQVMARPVVLRLAEYVGIEPKSTYQHAIEEAVALISKAQPGNSGGQATRRPAWNAGQGLRSRRRSALARRVVEREEIELADTTPLTSGHQRAGLWAFDQANANCSNGFIKFLEVTTADVVCGQEIKRPQGQQCKAFESTAKAKGWQAAAQPCGYGKQGFPSASTAVAARAHLGLAEVPGLALGGPLQARMSVQWLGSIARGGIFVGSIYLHSGEGMLARNLRMLEEAARVLMALLGPWILAGDFQVEPQALLESGFPRLAKWVVVAPSAPTGMGHTIDYFLVAEGLAGTVHAVVVLAGSPFAPHSPVRLLLKAAPRRLKVRIQAKPFRISATLPSGCLNSYGNEWFGSAAAAGGDGAIGGTGGGSGVPEGEGRLGMDERGDWGRKGRDGNEDETGH